MGVESDSDSISDSEQDSLSELALDVPVPVGDLLVRLRPLIAPGGDPDGDAIFIIRRLWAEADNIELDDWIPYARHAGRICLDADDPGLTAAAATFLVIYLSKLVHNPVIIVEAYTYWAAIDKYLASLDNGPDHELVRIRQSIDEAKAAVGRRDPEAARLLMSRIISEAGEVALRIPMIDDPDYELEALLTRCAFMRVCVATVTDPPSVGAEFTRAMPRLTSMMWLR